MTWRDIGWRELPQREYSGQQDRQLQVYGGCSVQLPSAGGPLRIVGETLACMHACNHPAVRQPQALPHTPFTCSPHAASYKYRRDYAAAVHGPWALKHLQPLPEADARRGGCAPPGAAQGRWPAADLDPPAMRQAIAWEFVLRDLREAEVGA